MSAHNFQLVVVTHAGQTVKSSYASADTAIGRARQSVEWACDRPQSAQVIRKSDGALVADALTGFQLPIDQWNGD